MNIYDLASRHKLNGDRLKQYANRHNSYMMEDENTVYPAYIVDLITRFNAYIKV